jgi:hypothetical protein
LSLARRSLAPAVLALALLACEDPGRADPVPLDVFAAPIGLASSGNDLLVVSSNSDLEYGYDDGGSVVPIALPADPGTPPAVRPGGVRIPSLGGQIAVADAAACGLPETQVFVPVRSNDTLYRIRMGADGTLACGDGCAIPLGGTYADPYGVAVVCRPDDPADPNDDHAAARAFVGMLRAPSRGGAIKVVDLRTDSVTTMEALPGRARAFAYDAARARLFVVHSDSIADAALGWIELAGGCDPAVGEADVASPRLGCPRRFVDLLDFVRGVDPQDIALGTPLDGTRRRIYVAARLYDPDLAAAFGFRPAGDTDGVLLVLEAEEGGRLGELAVSFVDQIPVGIGVSDVEVLPARPPAGGRPRRDLVAVTAADEGVLLLYDDDTGERQLFGREPTGPRAGVPQVGRAPFALLSRPLGPSSARLWVTAVADDHVVPVDVNLDDGSATLGTPIRGGAR